MGMMRSDGIDALAERMESLGIDLEGELGDRMLQAGAEVAKTGWVEEANARDIRDTGDMIRAIGYNKKPKNVQGLRTVYVYPQGEDKKRGVTHAAKAYYVHWKDNSRNRGWVDEVDQRVTSPVVAAMRAVLEQYLKEKGMT